ncbi:hypothetical protein FF011L_36210 [Roseimaritima multifibrata]|uniref:DUF1207 domain-containing protein n=1 Tax=Roseimaritima multifibrata TaxID=1930274 RepID=A0A517MIW8_9BACT|nr:DUF1207 domain-containing protein [Roseimaritima multifibrata]QDS94839.1 hypothetical protein FF011L_36210 [Roseimaritima multifibrata]
MPIRMILLGSIFVLSHLDIPLPSVSAGEGLEWENAGMIEASHFRESVMGDTVTVTTSGSDHSAAAGCREWQLLPDGLLWHSYLAAPHEPRISTVILQTNNEGVFWDATLGGRVGLIRYGTAGAVNASGWQWDLEAAAITRLDLLHAEDVESMDYRFGTEITAAEGPWAMKFGYFHISSHVGDEYMIRNPTFQRVNYVTESWIIGGSYLPRDDVRLYGEFANSFRASGGAKRYQFQTGAEYTPIAKVVARGAPFAAINLNFRQAVGWDVSTTVQAGWAFQSARSGRRVRFGLQYGDGPTSQFSFFQRRESYLGGGVWFDY